MTSSTMPQPGAPQPEAISTGAVRRIRKERSQPTLWAVATLFFLMGIAASTLTIWQLHKLYRATIAPPISVEGVVKAQYEYDEVDILNPPPVGYYIESSNMGRVYLSGQPLQSYVGEAVVATGTVSGVCGEKSIPCFPLIELRDLDYPDAAE
ncbi:MAG: hypothetical protein AAFV85_26510 [Cyanobacteria bacterium J06634_6]